MSETDRLERLLVLRDRQIARSEHFWMRAAKKALDGDMRELRNRVEMIEAEPVEVVLSDAALSPTNEA